jgi:hypothetical protein
MAWEAWASVQDLDSLDENTAKAFLLFRGLIDCMAVRRGRTLANVGPGVQGNGLSPMGLLPVFATTADVPLGSHFSEPPHALCTQDSLSAEFWSRFTQASQFLATNAARNRRSTQYCVPRFPSRPPHGCQPNLASFQDTLSEK